MKQLMLAAAAACGLAGSASAQPGREFDFVTAAQAAGDAVIAGNCKLRSEGWVKDAKAAVAAGLTRIARQDLRAMAGEGAEASALSLTTGANLEALQDGEREWKRYGAAACKATSNDGALARVDALVAAYRSGRR